MEYTITKYSLRNNLYSNVYIELLKWLKICIIMLFITIYSTIYTLIKNINILLKFWGICYDSMIGIKIDNGVFDK